VKVLSALHDGGSGDRFTTHLDRGGACRFQYTRPNGQTFTVVGDDRQGAASTPYGPAQRFESWRSALGSIVGVTAASALPAVQLFLGESRSESVLELRDVERLPDDQIRGVRCAVIRGRTPRQRFTIWIGPDNRMLRVQHFIGSAKEPVADVRYTEVTIR
jgi:hypothetical protein